MERLQTMGTALKFSRARRRDDYLISFLHSLGSSSDQGSSLSIKLLSVSSRCSGITVRRYLKYS